jgi:hypothetical protein
MTINDLHDIIMGDGYRRGYHTSNWDYYSIDGCELLEHISDIPDFVSLCLWLLMGGLIFVLVVSSFIGWRFINDD